VPGARLGRPWSSPAAQVPAVEVRQVHASSVASASPCCCSCATSLVSCQRVNATPATGSPLVFDTATVSTEPGTDPVSVEVVPSVGLSLPFSDVSEVLLLPLSVMSSADSRAGFGDSWAVVAPGDSSALDSFSAEPSDPSSPDSVDAGGSAGPSSACGAEAALPSSLPPFSVAVTPVCAASAGALGALSPRVSTAAHKAAKPAPTR